MGDNRTDEDRIIEALVIDGSSTSNVYDDVDFLPSRQSLYVIQKNTPDYDDETSPYIVWCRPSAICDNPEYFSSVPSKDFPACCAIQGTLPDEVFLGCLLAISAYPRADLIQNIFASRPEDFVKYGVYTCRFYVEGEWVEVITDSMIPCIRDEMTGVLAPVYGRTPNPTELWITLAEKAYAKAVGCYEAVRKVRIHEALLHLTGGSIQQISLQNMDRPGAATDKPSNSFDLIASKLEDDIVLLVTPLDKSAKRATDDDDGEGKKDDHPPGTADGNNRSGTPAAHSGPGTGGIALEGDNHDPYEQDKQPTVNPEEEKEKDGSDHSFLPNRLYSVVAAKAIGGFELLLLHNPWHASMDCWRGDFSADAQEWDIYPEICAELMDDPMIPWSRSNPNGYFWMSFRSFLKHFSSAYFVKLFNGDKFDFYCARGEWKGKEAGGPIQYVREKDKVVQDAQASRLNALNHACPAVVIDGDVSWFRNPQFRMYATGTGLGGMGGSAHTTVYISVLPVSTHDADGFQVVAFDVTASPKTVSTSLLSPNIWDASQIDQIACEKVDGAGRVKGQEVSLWELKIDTRHYYHIVPHTMRRGQEGGFILRVFSSAPIVVEKVAPLFSVTKSGDWRRTQEVDTTGGPWQLLQDVTKPVKKDAKEDAEREGTAIPKTRQVLKENTKWCQNPQFHVELENPYSKDDIYMKIIVRKSEAPKGRGGDTKTDATVGAVVCKASFLEDVVVAAKNRRKNGPRQNAMGEIIPFKESSLKKKKGSDYDDDLGMLERKDDDKDHSKHSSSSASNNRGPLQKIIAASKEVYHQQIGHCSKQETCVLFPRLPKAYVINGFIIVPSLSEKGTKGHFEIEVYASEPVLLKQLPDSFYRMIAGDWTDNNAGGSHLYPVSFKKNPKFILKLKQGKLRPLPSGDLPNPSDPVKTRIVVSRVGESWRPNVKKDTVGCMLGFYLFVRRSAPPTVPGQKDAQHGGGGGGAGEMIQVYESTFVPDEDVATEEDFMLEQIASDEEYVIMPTTFAEGKVGSFVISVSSDSEFSFVAEKK